MVMMIEDVDDDDDDDGDVMIKSVVTFKVG